MPKLIIDISTFDLSPSLTWNVRDFIGSNNQENGYHAHVRVEPSDVAMKHFIYTLAKEEEK